MNWSVKRAQNDSDTDANKVEYNVMYGARV